MGEKLNKWKSFIANLLVVTFNIFASMAFYTLCAVGISGIMTNIMGSQTTLLLFLGGILFIPICVVLFYFVNRFTTKKGWMRFNIGVHWFMFYCFSYNHPDSFVSDSRWFVLVLAIMMSVCIKLAFDKTKTIKEKIRYFFDYFKYQRDF